jgi:hypothetical protein
VVPGAEAGPFGKVIVRNGRKRVRRTHCGKADIFFFFFLPNSVSGKARLGGGERFFLLFDQRKQKKEKETEK